jgi:hypothetical protein
MLAATSILPFANRKNLTGMFGAEARAQTMQTVRQGGSRLFNGAKDFGAQAWGGVKNLAASEGMAGVKALGSQAWSGAKNLGSQAVTGVKNLGAQAWSGARDWGAKAWSGAKNLGDRAIIGAKNVGIRAANERDNLIYQAKVLEAKLSPAMATPDGMVIKPMPEPPTQRPLIPVPEKQKPLMMETHNPDGPQGAGPQGKGTTQQSEPGITQAQQPKVTAPNKSDLDKYRAELNVPDRNTVAVGKTDVPGLEGVTFKGASPQVRKDALLPDLDAIAPNRPIQSPQSAAMFKKHAEEGVINDFVNAANKANLKPDQVKGTLYMHQSNPSGFCTICLQGVGKPNVRAGILRQLSEKYPNLVIKGSSETAEGVKASGRHSFTLRNGEYIED